MENEFSNFGKSNNAGNFSGSFEQKPRGWFSRNMWWFMPLVLLFLVSPCVCCGGCYYMVTSTIRGSQPYNLTLQRVQNDPQVVEQLGKPIEQSGWMMGGKVDYGNNNGANSARSELEFDVAGPKGKAHVHAVLVKTKVDWTFQVLDVTPDTTGKTMSLLSVVPPEKPDEGQTPPEKPE